MNAAYTTVRRLTIAATVITALLFIDGIVLMATNGLKSDTTNVFPVLGGSLGNTTRPSGVNIIIIMAVILAIITGIGWVYSARMRAAQRRRDGGSVATASAGAVRTSGSPAAARHDG